MAGDASPLVLWSAYFPLVTPDPTRFLVYDWAYGFFCLRALRNYFRAETVFLGAFRRWGFVLYLNRKALQSYVLPARLYLDTRPPPYANRHA